MNFELLQLNELLGNLKTNITLEEKLSMIIREIECLVSYQSLGIYLRSKDSIRCKIARNLSHTFIKKSIFTEEEDFIRNLIGGKKQEFKDNIGIKFEFEYTHLMVIPVMFHSEFLGFVFIDRDSEYFTVEETVKFNLLCSLTALVVKLDQSQIELARKCEFDPVLHFYNYRYFVHRADYIFSLMKKFKQNLVLSVLKLYNYNEVIRIFGKNSVMDRKKEIASILKKYLANYEIIGLLEFDSFAILLPEQTAEDVKKILKKINTQIKNTIPVEYHISWGLCDLKNSIDKFEDMLKFAEEAAFESARIDSVTEEIIDFKLIEYNE